MTSSFILKIFFFIIFLFFFKDALPQGEGIKYDKYFFEQGLSQAQINCVAQDSTGYLWFGTQDGLNRFDGYEFKVYRNDPGNSGTISSNYIRSIFVDEQNDVWLTTHGGGLNKLDKYRNKFKRFLIDDKSTNSFNQNIMTAVYPGDRDNLIIGTEGYGLFVFNKKSGKFLKIEPLPADSRIISKILRLNEKYFFVGTSNGLFILDWTQKTITGVKNKLLDGQFIESYCKLANRTILIGTLSGYIYQIGSTDEYTTDIRVIDKYKKGSSIWAIFEDKNKSIWIGTESDLVLLPTLKDVNTKISARFSSQAKYFPYRTRCLYKDQSGILWIGTVNSGIMKAVIKSDFFEQITFADKTGLQDNSAWYVFKDHRGLVWIGTDGYGLIKYDREKDQLKRWTYDSRNAGSISHNSISFILQDRKNNLWISTYGAGINLFKGDDSFIHFKNNPNNPSSLVHDYVWCMLEDYKGNIWAGTKMGVDEFDVAKNSFKHYQHNPRDTNSLSNNLVLTLFEDSENNIWIGTFGGGLNKYDRKRQQFTIYKYHPDNPKSISDNSIMSITEDSKGNLWIGTDIGLNKFSKKSGAFTRYSVKEGLLDDMIYAAAVDENDNVWVSTNRGISVLDTDKKTFRNFNTSDGLLSEEFNQAACYRAPDGEIFFAGINGINSFYPKNLNLNIKQPKVVINKIMLFNNEIPPEKYFDKYSLEVSYNEDYLQFEFAALEFTNPGKNNYKYKLEGFNKEWIFAGNRRVAIFSNLDPGDYTLKILAANSDGVWNNKPLEFGLTVLPPYWQTWWFRFLIVITLAGILYIVYKIRIARLLEIERLRLQIASDLHDEVGSSLTSIAIQTQMLTGETDKEKITSRTNFIGGLTRDVISTMSDIIWSIDSRNDSLKDLIARMQNFSFNLFDDTSINVTYDLQIENPKKKVRPHIRQNLYLIFKEAVNNIYKHSGASEAKIKLSESANKIEMMISDNGKGVDAGKTYSGNGLKNLKMRAKRINAAIEFMNESGLTIKLSVTNK
ncbi:MAG: two-component regulator propeller domain-containing protein [bacterium]